MNSQALLSASQRKALAESNKPIPYQYSEKCFLCDGSKFGDVHVVLLPSLVGFCFKCGERVKYDPFITYIHHIVGKGVLAPNGEIIKTEGLMMESALVDKKGKVVFKVTDDSQ